MTGWTDLPGELFAGVDPAYPHEDDLSALMHGLAAARRGQSYLMWSHYQIIIALYDRLVAARTKTDGYIMDGYRECATRIARQAGITRRKAEIMIDTAIALRDRLPEVADTLRDGIATDWQIVLIAERTDLIDTHSVAMAYLDAEIAHLLRTKHGVWDRARLRDMVDRLVFRHDPDAVRKRRQDALDERGVWTHNLDNGAAELTAVMSAENVRIADAAIRALAGAVCSRDPRPRNIRNSDAAFALLSRTPFECQCDDAEQCTARIPDLDEAAVAVSTEVVIHVIADAATLAGGTGIGFLDGHGIITDEHVRDLAARDDAVLKPVVPVRTAPIAVVAETDSPGEDQRAQGIPTATPAASVDEAAGTSSGQVASIRRPLASSVQATRPAEPATRPAESGTQAAESGTPPAESVTRAAESDTRAAESATRPAESGTRPAESDTRSAESVARPAESVAQPAEDVDTEHNGLSAAIVVYPGAQPADPYRPTNACDTFVRIRDGYCTEPGCSRSAFTSDLDHVAEYDHTNPTAGGATSSENLNAKCRAGHLHKTHSDWVDLQYRDTDGRLVTEYITPEGIVLPGDAETLEDHFPNLRRIRFEQPAQAPPTPRTLERDTTPHPTSRLAAKHARRRAERARNQRRHAGDPPPF